MSYKRHTSGWSKLIPFFSFYAKPLGHRLCGFVSFVTYVYVVAVRASGNMVGIFGHMYCTTIAKPDI